MRREVLGLVRNLQSAQTDQPIAIPQELYGELRATLNRYIQTIVGEIEEFGEVLDPEVKRRMFQQDRFGTSIINKSTSREDDSLVAFYFLADGLEENPKVDEKIASLNRQQQQLRHRIHK